MKTRLTRIHLGLGHAEIGVQFETLDDANTPTSTQRAFVSVAEASTAPIWLAAQAALDAKLAELPPDLGPENVTNALMRQRSAEAARERAEKAAKEAEEQAKRAAAEMEAAIARKAAAEAEHASLANEIAQKEAARVELLVKRRELETAHEDAIVAIASDLERRRAEAADAATAIATDLAVKRADATAIAIDLEKKRAEAARLDAELAAKRAELEQQAKELEPGA